MSSTPRYSVADFTQIAGVPCPCGTARRAFADLDTFPGTVHVTEISQEAKLHYHKNLTETYYFLECGPDAKMELDDDLVLKAKSTVELRRQANPARLREQNRPTVWVSIDAEH